MILATSTLSRHSYMVGYLILNANIVLCWFNIGPKQQYQEYMMAEAISRAYNILV